MSLVLVIIATVCEPDLVMDTVLASHLQTNEIVMVFDLIT
jgi:hypothetical protein